VRESTTTEETKYVANVVIEANGYQVEYQGNWEPLVELINIAAATNSLFTVILTVEEYELLKGGELKILKMRFSERVASLLYLSAPGSRDKRPTLELYRLGHC
jgi:hypothetical protein